MVDISSSSWSEVDSSNTTANPNGWPAGMQPNQVEPTARMMMGAVKRFYDHINGTLTSGGSANAQTLTYSVAPAAYVTGDLYVFKAGASNTGATTLNINSLGATAVQKAGSALTGGEIVSGQYVIVIYDGTNFQLFTMPAAGLSTATTGSGNVVLATSPTITTPAIVGVSNGSNATAGNIGEVNSSNTPIGSAVTLTSSAAVYQIAAVTLTAGDWDVEGNVQFTSAGGGGWAWEAGLNLSSTPAFPTNNPTIGSGTGPVVLQTTNASAPVSNGQGLSTGAGRVSTNATVTVYLYAAMSFTGASPTAYGFLYARRAAH